MPSLAEPNSEFHASEATLGTTAASRSQSRNTKHRTSLGKNLQKWQGIFHSLPTELNVNIIAQLDDDPVSQICFGLTSSYFYWQVFHEVRDEREWLKEEKIYPIKRHPYDLRFQVSVCGKHSVYGWYEYGYLLDAWHVLWERSLGELLWEEKWLWKDLKCCWGCLKYKPRSAFGEFGWEKETLMYDPDWFGHLPEEDSRWYENACRRCRAKFLLVSLGKREEVREKRGNPFEETKSLGLKRLKGDDNADDIFEGRKKDWSTCRLWEEYEALIGKYETWESMFTKLGI